MTGWNIELVSSMTVLLKHGKSGLGLEKVSSDSGTSSSVHWLRRASIVCFSESNGSGLSVEEDFQFNICL